MIVGIERRLERLEGDWQRLLESVAGIDEMRLNRPPAEAKWSIAQIVSHLLQSEDLALRYLNKKSLAGAEMEKGRLASWWRLIALVVALRSPLRVRAPEVVATVPEHRRLDDLLEERKGPREGWHAFVTGYPDELLDRACYRHPYAGRLSLDQCLITLQEHLGHHAKQVARMTHR